MRKKGTCLLGEQEKRGKETFKDFSLLKPYLNKLHVMKVFDGICINLGGNDGKVLYLSFSL